MSDLHYFGHPFSSYTWKGLIALWEGDVPFTFRLIEPSEADNCAEWLRRWPIAKFPILVDGERTIVETSIIIEYLQRHYGGAPLIPDDADAALAVRMLDRIFDHHVMTPMQSIVGEHLMDATTPDPRRIDKAKAALDAAYGWLDQNIASQWACGGAFTLADCAAAPSLFYADWVHPTGSAYPRLSAYRARLLARPSVARAIEEARPYRAYFPLGAPDRD